MGAHKGRATLNKGKAQPAQDPRLAKWRDEGAILTVFLTNGTRLEGKIVAFDPQTILVDSGEQSLVYKTMILTISPPRKGARTGRRPPPREPRVPVVRYKRRVPDR